MGPRLMSPWRTELSLLERVSSHLAGSRNALGSAQAAWEVTGCQLGQGRICLSFTPTWPSHYGPGPPSPGVSSLWEPDLFQILALESSFLKETQHLLSPFSTSQPPPRGTSPVTSFRGSPFFSCDCARLHILKLRVHFSSSFLN